MQITECLHVAILVSQLERAEDFYGNILHLPKINRQLNFPGAWYEVGKFQLHLIVATNHTIEAHNTEKWGRNPHLAFAVTDLNAVKQNLLNHHYPIQHSASGRAAIFTQDPDGNVIEFTQV